MASVTLPWSSAAVPAERRIRALTRVAVILYERLGNWARQLRPRLCDQPLRWFETRSPADLEGVLAGLACPIVVIDLGRQVAAGLEVVDVVVRRASHPRTPG